MRSFLDRGIVLVLFLIPVAVMAKEIPPVPNPPRLVNDYANILTPIEEEMLEGKLVAFDDSTSNQIAIVIENSLEGDDAHRYSHEIAETWGIGHKENNGVLIYVAMQDRMVWIQVGYGLEPVITDAATVRIRENEINPAFREGTFFKGLDNATNVLMQLAAKEFSSSEYVKESKKDGIGLISIFIIIVIIAIIIISSRRGGGGSRGHHRSPWVFGPFMGGRGGFGGRGGGFGGGGFGGFGGGSFGGGGSGGSW